MVSGSILHARVGYCFPGILGGSTCVEEKKHDNDNSQPLAPGLIRLLKALARVETREDHQKNLRARFGP